MYPPVCTHPYDRQQLSDLKDPAVHLRAADQNPKATFEVLSGKTGGKLPHTQAQNNASTLSFLQQLIIQVFPGIELLKNVLRRASVGSNAAEQRGSNG